MQGRQAMKKEKPLTDGASKKSLPKWVLFVVIIGLLSLGVVMHKAWQKRRVAGELQSYQDVGLSATAAELETWCPPPPPEQNAALMLKEAADLTVYRQKNKEIKWREKDFPNDPNLGNMFPFLDISTTRARLSARYENPVNPPADWDQKNVVLLPIYDFARMPDVDEPIDDMTLSVMADYLNDNHQALQRLHQAVKLPKFRYLDYSQEIKSTRILMLCICIFEDMLYLETLFYAENQETDRVTQAVADSFRLANLLYQEPIILCSRLGLSVTKIAVLNLEYALNRCSLSRAQIQEINDIISEIQSAPRLYRSLIGERCLSADINYLMDGKSTYFIMHIGRTSLVSGGGGPAQFRERYFPHADLVGVPDMDHADYLNFMDRYIKMLDLPVEERVQAVNEIDDEVSSIPETFPITRLYTPRASKLLLLDIRYQAYLNAAQCALLVEKYRLDNGGRLPSGLEELVPDYVDTLPVDPYDGGYIKYKKTEDGYIVYSIGDDQKDDGGLPDPEPILGLYRPSRYKIIPDADFVFTVKRK